MQSALRSGFSFLGSSGNSKRYGKGWEKGQRTRPHRVMGMVFLGAGARQNACMLMKVVTSGAQQEADVGLLEGLFGDLTDCFGNTGLFSGLGYNLGGMWGCWWTTARGSPGKED